MIELDDDNNTLVTFGNGDMAVGINTDGDELVLAEALGPHKVGEQAALVQGKTTSDLVCVRLRFDTPESLDVFIEQARQLREGMSGDLSRAACH